MYNLFEAAGKYLNYYFTAASGKGHGIHSPFVFDFIQKVLNDKFSYPAYEEIEALRQELKNNHQEIQITDFGAGAVKGSVRTAKISRIVSRTAKSPKFGKLLYRIVARYKPSKLLELGTSLGISGCYLAKANSDGLLYTIEGAEAIANLAKENFNRLKLKNVHAYCGRFEDVLSGVLNSMETVDLAFIDGNHQKDPTIDYYTKILPFTHAGSVLIFDDIHWSREMEEAWEWLKAREEITLTIDLFRIGLVFFRNEQKEKQHFTIRF